MKNKIIILSLFVFIVLMINCPQVKAASAYLDKVGLQYVFGNNENTPVISVGGIQAYCAQHGVPLNTGDILTPTNALNRYNQDMITKMAIYDKCAKNIGGTEGYIIAQLKIWGLLGQLHVNSYYHKDRVAMGNDMSTEITMSQTKMARVDACYNKMLNEGGYLGIGQYWDGGSHQDTINLRLIQEKPLTLAPQANCTNCNSSSDSGSLTISDTTDFTSILNTIEYKSDLAKKGKTYFHKGNGVFCREDIKVTFPNANTNQITLSSGRYFVLNQEVGYNYATGVPNLKPVKVERIKECRVAFTSSEIKSGVASAATEHSRLAKVGYGDTGDVSLSYAETGGYKKYNKEVIKLKVDKSRTTHKLTTNNSSVDYDVFAAGRAKETGNPMYSHVAYTYKTTSYYNLDDDVYRWIRKRDGQSMFSKPVDDIGKYEDVGIANLPVSKENYGDSNGVGAKVTFHYTLPNDSSLKKNFSNGNSNPAVWNTNNTSINKLGNCYKGFYDTSSKYYTCNIKTCPEDTTFCPATNQCEKVCEESPKCQVLGGKYYGPDGQILKDKEEYDRLCPAGPLVCKKVGNKYYGAGGIEVSYEDYKIQCGINDFCTLCNGGKCCPDLDMVCPDANGECPGRGNSIIYRPIDLTNPFPGQTNYQRATGANWCAYNMRTGKITCKNTNGVATTHIQNNRSTGNERVYKLTPLYEVNLNPAIMKSIRKYNKNNEYDDFTLDCTNGKTCYSRFLRESGNGIKITGSCSNKANALTCAESRG